MVNTKKRLLEFEEFAKNWFDNDKKLQITYLFRRIQSQDFQRASLGPQQDLEEDLQDRIDELLAKENTNKRESLRKAFPQQH